LLIDAIGASSVDYLTWKMKAEALQLRFEIFTVLSVIEAVDKNGLKRYYGKL
jgi:hypothetical protein